MRFPTLFSIVIRLQLPGRVPVEVKQLLHVGLVHGGGDPALVHLGAVALVVVEAAGLGVDEPEGRRLAYAELFFWSHSPTR